MKQGKQSLVCLLFSVLLFFCCSNEKRNQYDDRTKYLTDYLHNNFGEAIPTEPHIYFIVKSNACQGCAMKLYKFIETFDVESSLIFVRGAGSHEFLGNINILHDKAGEIDRLNFDTEGTLIIFSNNNTIYHIESINPEKALMIEDIVYTVLNEEK